MDKVILISIGAAISFGFAAINYTVSGGLRAVQSGELELRCVINDESRTIAPSQVTGLMDGVWLFERGHAKNCEVIKGGDL